jgi:hypothetical protein
MGLRASHARNRCGLQLLDHARRVVRSERSEEGRFARGVLQNGGCRQTAVVGQNPTLKAMTKRVTPLLLSAALLVGTLWAALMMYAAWEHNPQARFHEGGIVQWADWMSVGAIHFVVASVMAAGMLFSARALLRCGRRRRDNTA